MGEAHRTLVGHFRHEIGHYYWDMLVKGRREAEFKAAFGDHERPTYAEAMQRHYEQGPPDGWWNSFVSGYATMHPWEDFAETWARYLAMASTLDTAANNGFGAPPDFADLDAMLLEYRRLGVGLNEMNRSMGLLDAVPEVFPPPVVQKLRFVHRLVGLGRGENGALQAGSPPDERPRPPVKRRRSAATCPKAKTQDPGSV